MALSFCEKHLAGTIDLVELKSTDPKDIGG
jgi:hypothetical protein